MTAGSAAMAFSSLPPLALAAKHWESGPYRTQKLNTRVNDRGART